jgi:hypothetical protein
MIRTRLPFPSARGSLLVEVSAALGLTVMLALFLMRGSLLAVSGSQWTVMQTLTDAFLTRESALAARIPFAEIAGDASPWPEMAEDGAAEDAQAVVLGKIAGGREVSGQLLRFRTAEEAASPDLPLSVWRLHSILTYQVGDKDYVKSRSTLRLQ